VTVVSSLSSMNLFAFVFFCCSFASAYTDRGIIKLDNTTFDRIIDGGKSVFVRFDKEYSYGDEHDAWKDFAAKLGDSAADMLVGDVGVSEYGDKDNSDLAERYAIKSDDFPQFRLFLKGTASTGSPLSYSGDKKSDAFLRYVQEKAGVWVGLPGQIKELDEIAKGFGKGSDDLIKKAEAAVKALDDKDADSGKYYVKVMTKIKSSAEFVKKETERLQKMVDDGSVTPAKKTQFGRRLNILSSFK